MSFIPEKAMHHAHAEPGETADQDGKIVPIKPAADGEAEAATDHTTRNWVLGAAGAGVAVAAAAAALLTLRSSSSAKPSRRRAPRRTAKTGTAAKTSAAKTGTAKTGAAKPATKAGRSTRKKAATTAA